MHVHASDAYPFPAGACKFSRPCNPRSFKEKDVALAAVRKTALLLGINRAYCLHRFAGVVAAQTCRQAFCIAGGPAHTYVCKRSAVRRSAALPPICLLTCRSRASSCAWSLAPLRRTGPSSASLRPYIRVCGRHAGHNSVLSYRRLSNAPKTALLMRSGRVKVANSRKKHVKRRKRCL